MPTPDKFIDEIASAVAKAIADAITDIPTPGGFLVPPGAMVDVVVMIRQLEKTKTVDAGMREKVIHVLRRVWGDSKILSRDDLDAICDGLDLWHDRKDAIAASSTDEWINCY